MKILLTGATGYIGKRILPVIVSQGHHVVCCVRDKKKLVLPKSVEGHCSVIENDLRQRVSLNNIPTDIDVAFYLVHSMSTSQNYDIIEKHSAINFRKVLSQTNVKQVIYLSGIVNSEALSKHLKSRKNVELELAKGTYALTTIRAGIIIGSGSASFEIIRDLVEKLPIMIAPQWLNTKCQPVGIPDVVKVLVGVIGNPKTYNRSFDISSSDTLTYKEMLLGFAKERGLRRRIWTIPIMTPKMSSYWLYFITSTSYKLAVALVDSMKVEIIAKDKEIFDILGFRPLSYIESIRRAFIKIEQNEIMSSWKDSTISGRFDYHISDFINVPKFGCYKDVRSKQIKDKKQCINKIWGIGGENGWYFANWLWKARGVMDVLVRGIGLRRGRTNKTEINAGDALDFWRVLYANKQEGRLLLFAEMKLPGDAWLEFRIEDNQLIQSATFRPKGVWGRIYWYAVLPFHGILFRGLLKKLTT